MPASSSPVSVVLVTLLVLGTSIWAGSIVTLVLVARVASRTLPPSVRVDFFRGLGRAQGVVGTAALVVALVSGAALLRDRPYDGLLAITAGVTALLVATAGIGVAQARRMTRRRRAAPDGLDDADVAARIRRGARQAAALRAAIAGLTLALILLGSALAT